MIDERPKLSTWTDAAREAGWWRVAAFDPSHSITRMHFVPDSHISRFPAIILDELFAGTSRRVV